MTWFRLDDGWWCHRKTLRVSDAAAGLFCKMGCYSSAQLSDGFVPDDVLATITKATEDETAALLGELVAAGSLTKATKRSIPGHEIHDFLVYNPSRKRVMADRKRRIEAGRKGGERSGKKRKHMLQAPASSTCFDDDEANASTSSKHTAKPRPVPSRPVQPVQPVPPATEDGGEALQSVRIARIAKWHADEMKAKRGATAIVPDLSGAGVCEPLLRNLSDSDLEAVVRAFVRDDDQWLADDRRKWGLRCLTADRANRYLVKASPPPKDGKRPPVWRDGVLIDKGDMHFNNGESPY